VINLSIQTGVVPKEFKIGKATPIYKSGSKQDMDNYRPITVLPICSKIFEKCIHRQLMTFFEENNLLNKNQFGFRSNRNTEHAAILFTDEIRKNMNAGEMTGAIFIDLSKAFDTLSHSQILTNLTKYGVTGVENELFANYLFNRKQAVIYNKTVSQFEAVTSGVPQGSILGPLLFLLSFDGLADCLKNCKITMYADDTVIYTSGKSKDEIEKSLTLDFKLATEWMANNELVINMKKGKTECMLFGTPQRTQDHQLNVEYQHRKINFTTSYKYLGVRLDPSLQFAEHLATTYKKASGRLYLLNRLRNDLTVKASLSIYNSLLLPLFTYCSILTCNSSNTYQEKLIRFEDRANRVIFKGAIRREKIPKSIIKLMKNRLCLEVYKCLNNLGCENFNDYFELMKNPTRNKGILTRLPKTKLESFKKSFFYYGAKCYNELPRHVRASESKSEFLKLLYDE
jgi:hypothetical protein